MSRFFAKERLNLDSKSQNHRTKRTNAQKLIKPCKFIPNCVKKSLRYYISCQLCTLVFIRNSEIAACLSPMSDSSFKIEKKNSAQY